MASSQPFRAIHVGDLHFWRVPLNPIRYFGKRLLGVGNLIAGGRARGFRQELAPILSRRLQELAPDVLLFSGDFSTTSLPSEFAAAARILGPAVDSTTRKTAYAVPGNHDCYTTYDLGAATFERVLGSTFNPTTHIKLAKLTDDLSLLSMNATTGNGMNSFGKVEEADIRLLREEVLPNLNGTKTLWFLCHFPAEEPPGVLRHDRGNQLLHSEKLLEIFSELPMRVFWLHGHHHYRWAYGSPQVRNLIWINGGAPLLRRGDLGPDMGFHELIYFKGETKLISHRRDKAGEWHKKYVPLPEPEEYINLQEWE